MMSTEITGVSQCRGGLAPAASLTDRAGKVRRRVPCLEAGCRGRRWPDPRPARW